MHQGYLNQCNRAANKEYYVFEFTKHKKKYQENMGHT